MESGWLLGLFFLGSGHASVCKIAQPAVLCPMPHCHPVCQHSWVLNPVQEALIHTHPKTFPLDYNWHIKVSAAAAVWATSWCYVSVVGLGIVPWKIKMAGYGLLSLKPQRNQNQNLFWMPKWIIHSCPLSWNNDSDLTFYNIPFLSLSML